MINKNRIVSLLLSSFLSLLLQACSGDNADVYKYINNTKARASRPVEQIPQFSSLAFFKFPENEQRRNPFKRIDTKKTSNMSEPDKNRMKQPLETFPLDTLKFVGTLKQASEVWALIKQPDGQISRLEVGNYMGQNFGRVIAIKDDRITLQETLKNNSMKWEKVITIFNLDTGN